MPLVKNVFVRIKTDGAAEAKGDLADIAERARAISRMDPMVKLTVTDKSALERLRALRIELTAMRLAGDKIGLARVANDLKVLGENANAPRLKLMALAAEMTAVRAATDRAAASVDGGGDGGGGGLLGALRRLFTKGGGISTAAGGIPGVPAGLPVPAIIAGLLVGLSALPFLAQAAAGAITLGLGGALTGLGVYAEMGTRKVKYQFSQLVSGKDGIQATLSNISPAFGQALATILNAARTFIPTFIRAFGPALNAIAGPLKDFGVMIAGTLASPQVTDAIQAVGQAFGALLKALTPMVPGMFASIADGITNIARAVAKNPKAIAEMISGIVHLIGALLDVLAWLTQVANYLEMHFIPAWKRFLKFFEQWGHDIAKNMNAFWHHTTNVFDGIRHDVAHYWDMTWNNTIGRLSNGVNDANRLLAGWWHDIAHWFDLIRHDVARWWDLTWTQTVSRTEHGIADVVRWFKGLPGRILAALAALPGMLFSAGQHAIQRLIDGLGSMLGSLGNMASQVAHKIAGFFGLSPAREGPLSGSGAPEIRGRHFTEALARGMMAGAPMLRIAAWENAKAMWGLKGGPWTIPGMGPAPAAPPGWNTPPGAVYPGAPMIHLSVAPGAENALLQALWPFLRAQIRARGGGGPQSVQRALGVVYR